MYVADQNLTKLGAANAATLSGIMVDSLAAYLTLGQALWFTGGVNETPTPEELQKVRAYECSMTNHSWEVLEDMRGPTAVLCSNCGEDSKLYRRISEDPEDST